MKNVTINLEDCNFKAREGLASSIRMTADVLAKLSKDKDWRVRYVVAGNANTDSTTLAKLSKDEDSDVCKTARRNLKNR